MPKAINVDIINKLYNEVETTDKAIKDIADELGISYSSCLKYAKMKFSDDFIKSRIITSTSIKLKKC